MVPSNHRPHLRILRIEGAQTYKKNKDNLFNQLRTEILPNPQKETEEVFRTSNRHEQGKTSLQQNKNVGNAEQWNILKGLRKNQHTETNNKTASCCSSETQDNMSINGNK